MEEGREEAEEGAAGRLCGESPFCSWTTAAPRIPLPCLPSPKENSFPCPGTRAKNVLSTETLRIEMFRAFTRTTSWDVVHDEQIPGPFTQSPEVQRVI